MGNCLKTQLKETVNNPNLLKMEEFKFTLPAGITNQRFSMRGRKDDSLEYITISLVSGTCTLTLDGVTQSFPYVDNLIYSNSTLLISTETECVFSVTSKYNMHRISRAMHWASNRINLSDLKYCNISTLDSNPKPNNGNSAIMGDIKNFYFENWNNSVNLANMYDVYGDIAECGKCPFSEYITFNITTYNTKVSGRLEDLVAVARAKGVTSYSTGISFPYSNEIITFNGNPVPKKDQAPLLTWTADTITLDDVTINA